MRKRLIICTDRKFPRGDAGANRILFMGKALQEKGWEVFVVSTGKNEDKFYDRDRNCFKYENIKYRNIDTSNNKYIRIIQHNFIDGKKIVNFLRWLKVDSDDKILLYTGSYPFAKSIIEFALKINCKIACDVVEWHQPFQFKKGEKDIKYKAYKKFFEILIPKTKNVIAISHCLGNYFTSIGCNTIVLPIYVDTDNRQPWSRKVDEEYLHLIYPGNPYRKDDLLVMLQALEGLQDIEKDYIKFHLTGVSIDLLYDCIPGQKNLLDALIKKGIVLVHSWMEYDELIKLYEKIDFALIARPINKVTKANFPSKVPELLNKGIPVIINEIGDIVEYLTDGENSLLYHEDTPESCMRAIRRAINMSITERERMSKASYDTADEKFNYHHCSDLLDRFFLELR